MDTFEYISVLTSVILGLGVTHLLKGVGRLIQHPGRTSTYWVHLVWVYFMFFAAVFWWWYEFAYVDVETWTLPLYLFVLSYAVLLYLMCALLIPGDLEGYTGYRHYFLDRRTWFFACLAAFFLLDFADTWLKGTEYFRSLGVQYPIGIALHLTLCVTAIVTRDPRFHGAYSLFAVFSQVSWAFGNYPTAG